MMNILRHIKGGSIIDEGWPSTNVPLLENVGFWGAFLL
jgi:hypothetical protein